MILNFGSLNIDYVYSLEHFVRAGETISSSKMEKFPGGKGLNQSVAFAKAGACVFHAGCIGKEGQFLIDTLAKAGVSTELVQIKDTPTGHAIIQVNKNGENCILLYGGANITVDSAFIDTALSKFSSNDYLVLQNEINSISEIIEKAKARGIKIILNPSPYNEVIDNLDLNKIDYLILNEIEGKELTAKEEANEIIDTLLTLYPEMKIVLTLGKDGAMYASSKERHRQPIFESTVVDTTAAGDTFTGYFFAMLSEGKSPKESLEIASRASSIAVSRMGAAVSIPTLKEVLNK